MVKVGLFVRLEAKTGHEEEVESFLREGLRLVDEEPATVVWFAFRIGPSTFGIFDAFPDDEGRRAHLAGQVASALEERASAMLAEPPTIEPFDVLAAKIPAAAVPAGDAG